MTGIASNAGEAESGKRTAQSTTSSVLPITLPNGEKWYGLTSPPGDTAVRADHPRLLVTSDTLQALREKLTHPVYAGDVARIQASTNEGDLAFCYLVWGDEAKGREAIATLLDWSFEEWTGLSYGAKQLQGVLMYDWLHNLMTPEQRRRAASVIRANMSPKDERVHYWHSDRWSRRHGQQSVLEALTVDNDWSKQERRKLLDSSYTGFKVYRGALDIMTQMALQNGGGWHGGQTSAHILNGYEMSFALYGAIILRGWETATGESLLDRTTYMEALPYDIAKSRIGHFPESSRYGSYLMEYCTGINSPESASLAKWLLDKYGRQNNRHALVSRMILGDLRVMPKSPQELGVPLFGYQDGANCVFVRPNWGCEATHFAFFARCWDRGRYEQSSSHLAISKRQRPVLPLAGESKGVGNKAFTQLRVWDPGDPMTAYQGNTMWAPKFGGAMPAQPGKHRAYLAEHVVDPDKPWYRPETLTHLSERDGVVTATTRFEKLLSVVTPLAERTVVIDPRKETVLVKDRVELAEGLATESNYGLTEKPSIEGNVIENSVLRITVFTPFKEIVWDTDEREKDNRGFLWTIGTVKIRPEPVDGKVETEMLVEVK